MLAWPGVCKSQTTEEVSGFRSDWLPADFSCTFATYENLDDNCNRTIASVPGPWSPIQNRPQNLLRCQQNFEKLPSLTHMKPNREKIEAEELVKERLPLTKWELTPKEKEDFDRVMRLMFDAANILRYDLELGEDAIGKTLKELADWATN